jgi:Zn-dependent M28 family amino/carboxypeptidase
LTGDLGRRLAAHVDVLAGAIGERHLGRPGALDEAAAYLERVLVAHGLPVSNQEFTAAGQRVRNLEAVVPGAGVPGPVVVLGAHYDTVPGSPGADDNASGVAALLEIAAAVSRAAPIREVRCAFFANEEPPWFQTDDMGSLHYARGLRRRGAEVAAMLSLESIGYYDDRPGSQRYPFPLGLAYPDTGDFLGIVSDRRSRGLLDRVVASFQRHTAFPVQGAAVPGWIPGVSWSDQWAFWQQGFPAVMLTDTAPYRHPGYHTPDDTADRLRFDALETVAAALASVVLDLAAV